MGAVLSLVENADALTVTSAHEDHLDKYRLVAELAWAGLCEGGRPVVHLNADPSDWSVAQTAHLTEAVRKRERRGFES